MIPVSDMDFGRKGTLITHNNTAYMPQSLMPGYCGHVPTTKFQNGETFGNSTLKYFQNSRSATLASSKSHFYTADGSVSTLRSHMHTNSPMMPYWVQYNIDFKRQNEIKDFNMLSQKHRENYKDKTGTVQSVNYFVMPVKKPVSSPPESIVCRVYMNGKESLSPKLTKSEGVNVIKTASRGR